VRCVLCGRAMGQPAVTIGAMPVGPKCARRSGLMPLAAKKIGAVRPGPAYKRSATRQELDQMDLFGEVA
jgi:hypothetical protein